MTLLRHRAAPTDAEESANAYGSAEFSAVTSDAEATGLTTGPLHRVQIAAVVHQLD